MSLVNDQVVKLVDTIGDKVSPATSPRQDTMIANLETLNSLVPTKFDYIALGYTGANLTTAVYKLGGASGTTISTLTLAYDGSDNLISVTKS